MEYLSRERYDEISAELKQLFEVEYLKIREELSEARAQGDLSENFEYRAARRAQAKTNKPHQLPAEGAALLAGD